MGWLIAVPLRLLAPTRTTGRLPLLATVAAFMLGTALGCAWLLSVAPPAGLAVVVVALGVLAVLAVSGRSAVVRMLATAPLVVVHLFWIYIAVTLGGLLAWTTALPVRGLAALLALVAVGGAVASNARFRLPAAVPLGFWIAACLVGWMREDGVIRCDDYLAARSSSAAVLVPTTDELERCRSGESLRIGHYPRRLWEAPEGGRLVITTQRGISRLLPPGRAVADQLPGTVCEVPIGGTPACFGDGKAEALVESPSRDRLFVAGWQQHFADGSRGVLYVLSRAAPLRVLDEVHLPESVVQLFYDPASDTVGLLSDEAEVMQPVRIADRAVLDPLPAPIIPGETHYDGKDGDGVFCFAAGPLGRLAGEPFLSVAFRTQPFVLRPLGGANRNPTAWLSMVWGCDWDASTRLVYVADSSLGVLATIDYDSGRVLRRSRIDFGTRYVTFDRQRRLVYLANFLRGDIVAFDFEAGVEVARWFAGRFVRQVVLTRDRRALLVTSNLGVVRIPLEGLHAPPRGR